MDSTQQKVTVSQALELALAAGFTITRPTVLAMFKRSGAVKLGSKFHLPKSIFEQLLKEGEQNAT